jgi:hypothetical protein
LQLGDYFDKHLTHESKRSGIPCVKKCKSSKGVRESPPEPIFFLRSTAGQNAVIFADRMEAELLLVGQIKRKLFFWNRLSR